MVEDRDAPALFFAPFVSSVMRLEPGWIDINGHLNVAYYHVLFDRATDELLALVGLDAGYITARQLSYFVAECHLLYKREVRPADRVRVTARLIAFDAKRMQLYLEMRHAEEGWLAASCETMALHVDMRERKVAPFPADILANLALMKASHDRMPPPALLGRAIAMPARPGRPAGATTAQRPVDAQA